MIDLHMHSMFSDGTFTPEELIAEGVRCGLTAMALTDHDTTAGVPRFLAAAQAAGLRAFAGVEVSADVDVGTMHVLGYGVDPANRTLIEHLRWIREGRDERNREILHKLNQLGMRLTYEEVTAHAGADVVARPHFAMAMIEKGYARNKKDAFDRFLARGKRAYAERRRLDASATFELIRTAGGLPVLAHPFTLKLTGTAFRKAIEALKAIGLGGLEVHYPEHTSDLFREYSRVARDLSLLATGGSDFHGAVSPGIEMGRGFGSLNVPDEVADQLDALLHR
jgi:predicted metal-dependent phosphoesterase TrpH